MALVVDIGSTVFVDIVKQIEGPNALSLGNYAILDDPDNASLKKVVKVGPTPGGGPYAPIINSDIILKVNNDDLSSFNYISGKSWYPENSNASSDNIIIVSNDINPDHPGYLLASGQVPEEYKILGQTDSKKFTTQKASEKMFDAIADAIENGTISNGTLKTLGSPTGSISEMTEKLIEIITPMAKIVLGNNYEMYSNAISNQAQVLAAGVERVNSVDAGDNITTEEALSALIKIVQTQSVWQGDANSALEDSNPNNNWLNLNFQLKEGVSFVPIDADGNAVSEDKEGYASFAGYELKETAKKLIMKILNGIA